MYTCLMWFVLRVLFTTCHKQAPTPPHPIPYTHTCTLVVRVYKEIGTLLIELSHREIPNQSTVPTLQPLGLDKRTAYSYCCKSWTYCRPIFLLSTLLPPSFLQPCFYWTSTMKCMCGLVGGQCKLMHASERRISLQEMLMCASLVTRGWQWKQPSTMPKVKYTSGVVKEKRRWCLVLARVLVMC